MSNEMQGKHLDILRQCVPSASRVTYQPTKFILAINLKTTMHSASKYLPHWSRAPTR